MRRWTRFSRDGLTIFSSPFSPSFRPSQKVAAAPAIAPMVARTAYSQNSSGLRAAMMMTTKSIPSGRKNTSEESSRPIATTPAGVRKYPSILPFAIRALRPARYRHATSAVGSDSREISAGPDTAALPHRPGTPVPCRLRLRLRNRPGHAANPLRRVQLLRLPALVVAVPRRHAGAVAADCCGGTYPDFTAIIRWPGTDDGSTPIRSASR